MPQPPSTDTAPKIPQTADDINELFNALDTEEPVKEKVKGTKEVEEEKEVKEPEELEEDEELELKEPEEETEKLDLEKPEEDIDIEAPPRKKEILAKYPDIFKTFPFLEKMMYRDKEYTELFGSFDDAKEIAEKSETFNAFESQLLEGNTEQILRNVKDVDENAFKTIVDEYLPTLAKIDKEAYLHVTGNLNRRLIMEMVQEANETNNEDLKQAALLVNQFVFGTAKFTAPTRLMEKKAENAEQSEAEKERLSFARERYETARDDLQTQVDNTLRATVTEYIDPRGVMTPYVKRNAVADAMKYLTSAIARDESVIKNLDKLWRGAFDNKFSKDTLGKIKSYYLSKAKANMKNAIIKARAEALKDASPKNREKEEEEETTSQRRRVITPGKPSQPKTGKNEMKKGESITEFFMRD